MGKVYKPNEWYNAKLNSNSNLKNDSEKLNCLKKFIDFLENSSYYMSVIENGRDTKNSSIYNVESTEQQHWLCDIKFFEEDNFADKLIVVGKERMNTAGQIYENLNFSKTLEVIVEKTMELSPYGEIKEQIVFDDFSDALKLVEKALKVYRIFRS